MLTFFSYFYFLLSFIFTATYVSANLASLHFLTTFTNFCQFYIYYFVLLFFAIGCVKNM